MRGRESAPTGVLAEIPLAIASKQLSEISDNCFYPGLRVIRGR